MELKPALTSWSFDDFKQKATPQTDVLDQFARIRAIGPDLFNARKLLLHQIEIRKLIGKTTERGLTIVPLRMYFKRGRVKVAISLVKGKQVHDKRETIRRRETDRETRAAVKERVRA